MTTEYIQALVALGPVGVALGEVSALTPCAIGYYARVGLCGATGPTPTAAVRALVEALACSLTRESWFTRDGDQRDRLCDALAESFEAVGGRWWEV